MEKGDTLSGIDFKRTGKFESLLPIADDIQPFRKTKTGVVERFEKEYFTRLLRPCSGT